MATAMIIPKHELNNQCRLASEKRASKLTTQRGNVETWNVAIELPTTSRTWAISSMPWAFSARQVYLAESVPRRSPICSVERTAFNRASSASCSSSATDGDVRTAALTTYLPLGCSSLTPTSTPSCNSPNSIRLI